MLIVAMCSIVAIEIVCRYFLNRPQDWAVETCEYMLLWLTFLASAWVLRKEGHVKIDILINRLNPGSLSLTNTITSVICAIVCLVIVCYSGYVAWTYYQQGIIVPKTLQIPKSPVLAIITVGSFMLFVQFLRRACGYLSTWRALQKK